MQGFLLSPAPWCASLRYCLLYALERQDSLQTATS